MEFATEWWPNNGWDIRGKGRRGRKATAKPKFEQWKETVGQGQTNKETPMEMAGSGQTATE